MEVATSTEDLTLLRIDAESAGGKSGSRRDRHRTLRVVISDPSKRAEDSAERDMLGRRQNARRSVVFGRRLATKKAARSAARSVGERLTTRERAAISEALGWRSRADALFACASSSRIRTMPTQPFSVAPSPIPPGIG